MDPTTVGGLIGGGFIVLYAAVKTIDRVLNGKSGPRQSFSCPLNADPELRSFVAKLTEVQTTQLAMLTKLIDFTQESQESATALLTKSVDLLREIQTDHRIQDSKLEDMRRTLDGMRLGDTT